MTVDESQDIALVSAKKGGRVLVGGKMGSGGFTIAWHLNVFVEIYQATAVVAELIKIFRDQGPREARSKCRFAFLVERWGIPRLRKELTSRMGYELALQGRDMRNSHHADHIGRISQTQVGLVAVGHCVPIGRVNPEQLDGLARLSDAYGQGEVRLTTGQNALIPHVPAERVTKFLNEPLAQAILAQSVSFSSADVWLVSALTIAISH
jgi:ferredoxin-nitrite reductase